MVHRNDEHGSHIHPAASIALQRTLAGDHLQHILRTQSRPLPAIPLHILPAVHSLPQDLCSRASASAPESVLGHLPRGPRNAD